MANLETSSDIIQDCLFRIGEQTNANSQYYQQVISDVNRAYKSLCIGGAEIDPNFDEDWWWLRSLTPQPVTLVPSFNSGSVSVTTGSQSITFNTISTDWTGANQSLVGWFFSVTGDDGDIYRIITHASGSTSATIDSPYTDATNAAASFKAFKLQYTLPASVNKIIGKIRMFQDSKYHCQSTNLTRLMERWPLNQVWNGMPEEFAYVTGGGNSSNTTTIIQFSHYPGDLITNVARAEFDYTIRVADLQDDGGETAPLMPVEYNHILSDWACYLNLLNKDEQKASTFEQMAKGGLQAMAAENRRRAIKTTSETGAIFPRLRDRNRFDEPLRTSTGLIIG